MVNHAMHSMAEVDLAGSERLAKSGVSGDRQKEAPLSRCDRLLWGNRGDQGVANSRFSIVPAFAQTWPKSFAM